VICCPLESLRRRCIVSLGPPFPFYDLTVVPSPMLPPPLEFLAILYPPPPPILTLRCSPHPLSAGKPNSGLRCSLPRGFPDSPLCHHVLFLVFFNDASIILLFVHSDPCTFSIKISLILFAGFLGFCPLEFSYSNPGVSVFEGVRLISPPSP